MPNYTDNPVNNLVINKITQAKYNELANQGLINQNEIYAVEDASINALNKTIINVAAPVNDFDAANKAYVDNRVDKIRGSVVGAANSSQFKNGELITPVGSSTNVFSIFRFSDLGMTIYGGYATGLYYQEDGGDVTVCTLAGVDMTTQRVTKVEHGNGLFVATFENGSTYENIMAWSYDGKAWIYCTIPSNLKTPKGLSVAYNDKIGIWCAQAHTYSGNPGELYSLSLFSNDGKTYQYGPQMSSYVGYSCIPYKNGFAVARISTDCIITYDNISYDNINGVWTATITELSSFNAVTELGIAPTARGFAYGNGFFLVGDQSGNKIARVYEDGSCITTTLPSGDMIRSIRFSNGTFIVAGYNHLYLTEDGLEFIEPSGFNPSPHAGKIYFADLSNNKAYVALRANGAAIYTLSYNDDVDISLMERVYKIVNMAIDSRFPNGEEMTFGV